mmetsp:Transcript_41571/g.117744  ORF Transcript_41571/g.117744 Transcript_41571/m.117744 type:complete len:216 (-) Transcript_41571:129-776(-)|eukprot:CAMPEP_0176271582 /NCGR_PEP_ID=MMETSP0121_2-20121125/45277_1 /TAXON_ID=160619 /ORGANISM="Kryptoperidinium foliaceum, Strain CCMP 1326" /LENGTH=215 /DNA_ID=CAMNT_0017611737 /DNA_START=48 /DNA_END=695 /DNA_ORIENTATION=+
MCDGGGAESAIERTFGHVVWGSIDVSGSSVSSCSATPVGRSRDHVVILPVSDSDKSSAVTVSGQSGSPPISGAKEDKAKDAGEVDDADGTETIRKFLVKARIEHLWSEGGRQHVQGTCRPCHFFHTGSCRNGQSCRFCHLPHAKRTDAKTKRDMCRQLAVEVLDDDVGQSLDLLCSHSPVLRTALQKRLHQDSPATCQTPSPRCATESRANILSL